jgi:hypothetical protein
MGEPHPDSPCIILMDSLDCHSKTRVCKFLRQYLNFAWKERVEKLSPDQPVIISEWKSSVDNVFTNVTLPVVAPNIPPQTNSCDCGVFILEYAEGFLELIPELLVTENDVKNQLGSHVSSAWFKSEKIPKKRNNLLKLIDKLSVEYQTTRALNASAGDANGTGEGADADDDDDEDDICQTLNDGQQERDLDARAAAGRAALARAEAAKAAANEGSQDSGAAGDAGVGDAGVGDAGVGDGARDASPGGNASEKGDATKVPADSTGDGDGGVVGGGGGGGGDERGLDPTTDSVEDKGASDTGDTGDKRPTQHVESDESQARRQVVGSDDTNKTNGGEEEEDLGGESLGASLEKLSVSSSAADHNHTTTQSRPKRSPRTRVQASIEPTEGSSSSSSGGSGSEGEFDVLGGARRSKSCVSRRKSRQSVAAKGEESSGNEVRVNGHSGGKTKNEIIGDTSMKPEWVVQSEDDEDIGDTVEQQVVGMNNHAMSHPPNDEDEMNAMSSTMTPIRKSRDTRGGYDSNDDTLRLGGDGDVAQRSSINNNGNMRRRGGGEAPEEEEETKKESSTVPRDDADVVEIIDTQEEDSTLEQVVGASDVDDEDEAPLSALDPRKTKTRKKATARKSQASTGKRKRTTSVESVESNDGAAGGAGAGASSTSGPRNRTQRRRKTSERKSTAPPRRPRTKSRTRSRSDLAFTSSDSD